MKWNMPKCAKCKQPIEKRSDSIFRYDIIVGDSYQHYSCYLKESIEGTEFGAPILQGSGTGALAVKNQMDEYRQIEKSGDRKGLQNIITRTTGWALAFGILLDLMTVLVIANITRIKLDWIQIIAFAIFAIVGFFLTASHTIYRFRLAEHEKEISAGN